MAPALIFFIIGILVAGWTFHSVSSVRYALAEAGRALQMNPEMTEAELAAIVRTRAGTIIDPDLSVTLTIGPPNGGIKLAEATADYVVTFQAPFLPPLDFDFETSVTVPLASS